MRWLGLLFALGCQPQAHTGALFERAPDFALVDVNPGSQTYAQEISPRDAEGMASAWYFGHSS